MEIEWTDKPGLPMEIEHIEDFRFIESPLLPVKVKEAPKPTTLLFCLLGRLD
jgi:hypothetical protein